MPGKSLETKPSKTGFMERYTLMTSMARRPGPRVPYIYRTPLRYLTRL